MLINTSEKNRAVNKKGNRPSFLRRQCLKFHFKRIAVFIIDIMEVFNIGGNQVQSEVFRTPETGSGGFSPQDIPKIRWELPADSALLFGSSAGILFIKFILIHVLSAALMRSSIKK